MTSLTRPEGAADNHMNIGGLSGVDLWLLPLLSLCPPLKRKRLLALFKRNGIHSCSFTLPDGTSYRIADGVIRELPRGARTSVL